MFSAGHDRWPNTKINQFGDYFPHPKFHSWSNATAAVHTLITHHINTSQLNTGLAPSYSSHIAPGQLRGITENADTWGF